MVKSYSALALIALPCSLFGFNPFGVGKDQIVESLQALAAKNLEDQKSYILLAHGIDKNGELVKENGKLNLKSPILIQLYEISTDKEAFQHDFISKFTLDELHQLINEVKKSRSYSQLMVDISSEACHQLGIDGDPFYFGAMPVVDWLNTAHFKGFFNPTMTTALINRDVHNEFDSFNQWSLWAEPFGFYTEFRNEPDPLKFNQYTVGMNVGIDWTFFDRLVFGLGVAYSHSGVDWENESNKTAGVDTLYFGPTINYVFSHGYLGCTLFGVANFYQVIRDAAPFPAFIEPKQTTTDYMSWDLVTRFEGGLSFSPGGQFYFSPVARVDFLNVFEQGCSEPLDEEIELTVEGFNESFLSTKIGLNISREFYQPTFGFIIPYLSSGWINFSPLTVNEYHFAIQECADLKNKLDVKAWSQYYFGIGLSIVHKKAILISLDYELTAGADSPVQAGNLRLEFSW